MGVNKLPTGRRHESTQRRADCYLETDNLKLKSCLACLRTSNIVIVPEPPNLFFQSSPKSDFCFEMPVLVLAIREQAISAAVVIPSA